MSISSFLLHSIFFFLDYTRIRVLSRIQLVQKKDVKWERNERKTSRRNAKKHCAQEPLDLDTKISRADYTLLNNTERVEVKVSLDSQWSWRIENLNCLINLSNVFRLLSETQWNWNTFFFSTTPCHRSIIDRFGSDRSVERKGLETNKLERHEWKFE